YGSSLGGRLGSETVMYILKSQPADALYHPPVFDIFNLHSDSLIDSFLNPVIHLIYAHSCKQGHTVNYFISDVIRHDGGGNDNIIIINPVDFIAYLRLM